MEDDFAEQIAAQSDTMIGERIDAAVERCTAGTKGIAMRVSLPLDEMTVEEKLKVMEDIWEDLSRNADDVPPPAWHGDVLKSIEAAIERGDESYENWETAKRSIRDQLGLKSNGPPRPDRHEF